MRTFVLFLVIGSALARPRDIQDRLHPEEVKHILGIEDDEFGAAKGGGGGGGGGNGLLLEAGGRLGEASFRFLTMASPSLEGPTG